MYFAFLSLITIIPALIVVWSGEQLAAHSPHGTTANHRSIYLILAAGVILAYISFYAHSFVDGDVSWLILFLLPALEGLLALIFVSHREIVDLWKTNRLPVSIVLVAILILLGYIALQPNSGRALIVLIVPAALAVLVWEVGRRFTIEGLNIIALALAVFFAFDAVGLLASPSLMSSEWRAAYSIATAIGAILALSTAALIVYRSSSNQRGQAGGMLAAAGLALLALAASEVRHGVMAKATGRAAEDHSPLMIILFAILVGVVLYGVMQKENQIRRVAFLLLAPALIAAGYTLGWKIDPQAITTARAERITQAIESYHAESGEYPQEISQLTPGYMLYMLGPLTGRGQVWCYQSGQDYYRLGYVFFQRYYRPTIPDPLSEIRIVASAGEPPPGEWMCDAELEKYLPTLGL